MNRTNRRARADDLTGVVLAGGYSRRFGERDKALARVGGRPLLARVVGRLGKVADQVVVNCRTDQREAFADALDAVAVPVAFVTDPVPDRGPLFGFGTALDAVETGTCALAACDTPFLDPRTVADLAERLDANRGRRHPTPAVYRTGPAADACDALLDADEARLSALFDRLDHRAVPVDDAAGNASLSLFDVDAPEDRKFAVELLKAASGSLTRRSVPRPDRARPQ